MIFGVVYLPMNFVSIYVLKRFGLRVSVIVGAIFTMTGCWIRLTIALSTYTVFLVGSAIGGLGQPFLMNNSAKLASNWFGDKERGIATAVGSMAVPIGMLISFVLPNTVITN